MAKITFVEFSGVRHDVQLEPGKTIAQAALDSFVPGIDADCGGNCACATCHVFLPAEWLQKLEPQSETEELMLELTPELQSNSRLACQINITEAMDGMEVHLPEFQM